jgi:carbon-monoxide dehydrogenase large subunit
MGQVISLETIPMAYIGERIGRREDPRLVTGAGQYVGDLTFPHLMHAGFVRSPYARARILAVDLSAARRHPGVCAAYAASDLPELSQPTASPPVPPGLRGHGLFPLNRDMVRYMGDPLAVVLTEDPSVLEDAVALVDVEYEPLEPVMDVERAGDGHDLVWEDVPNNVAVDMTISKDDVERAFGQADIVVEETFHFSRAAGAAMEPRSVAAVPGGDGEPRLTLWDSTQAPHNVRDAVAGYLGLQPDEVRVVCPDVGGGFGVKGRLYAEELVVAALALREGRPVRWVAGRTEDLSTTAQGRGQVHHARLAARSDGTILALDDDFLQDVGAYTGGVMLVFNTSRHLMGPYRVPALRGHFTALYTDKVMISPLRGGGRPQGIYVMERLLDRLAERIGLDRAEVRRRNFVPPDAFPYDTGLEMAGARVVYDSGNFPEYLERALEAVDEPAFRRKQQEERERGRYLGLGLCAFIESTGTGAEGARITIKEDGAVEVAIGSPSQGQGHATTFAQTVADRLGVPFESVRILSGDTAAFDWGTGTFASRMGTYGNNAASLASQEVRERALAIAADMLEAAPVDLEIVEGNVQVKGVPGRGVALSLVAQQAASRGEPLEAEATFQPQRPSTWAGGVNAAIVEVDVETGKVRVLRYVVVHDSGTIVNPTVVEGQVHGGVIHGIGNALFEESVYDQDGGLLTSTFADYDLPGPGDVPMVEIIHCETPSPFNPEGIKGAGEGGTIGAIPTVVGAVEDALTPFGITITDVPIRPETIAMKVRAARTSTTPSPSS